MASSTLVTCDATTECVALGETTGTGTITFCLCGQTNLELWVAEQIAADGYLAATSETALCTANFGFWTTASGAETASPMDYAGCDTAGGCTVST